ncbi:MAG: hypothetical protein EZS28_007222 [Streblomastix strix]|uniref:Uncharacterized protein n=1 Tax=Streblomastix strix TaxID=222440 RepID=A0A5J4WQL5_9EUKA|nr:MAG: hypothetical protein EZS28_007222 [Streblomastix strix]
MGAVLGPLGANNPTAGMIARGVGGAAVNINKNFGSKILSGVKQATGYVPNTLAKLLASTQMRSDAVINKPTHIQPKPIDYVYQSKNLINR